MTRERLLTEPHITGPSIERQEKECSLTLDIPSVEELNEQPLERLYARWKVNHEHLLEFLNDHAQDVRPFGLHGCAKDSLEYLLKQESGSILIATSNFFQLPPQDFLANLYAICGYTISYMLTNNRVVQQGVGGIVYVHRAIRRGKLIGFSSGRLKTRGTFLINDLDDKDFCLLNERIDENTKLPDEQAAVEVMAPFSRSEKNEEDWLNDQVPKLMYSGERAKRFLLKPTKTDMSHLIRSSMARRFLIQDILQEALKEAMRPTTKN